MSSKISQLSQNCEKEKTWGTSDMEAVLKKMKALRVEKENVFSQVDPRFV